LANLASSGKTFDIFVKILKFPIVIKVGKVIYEFKSHNFVKIWHRREVYVTHRKCQVKTSARFATEGRLEDIGGAVKAIDC
jgi:hypothetical protein